MSNLAKPNKKVSQYAPIWERLKQKDIVKLHVLPDDYYTVKRMISKIKDQDAAFKMMNEIEDFKLSFKYDPVQEVLEVKLHARTGLFDKVIV